MQLLVALASLLLGLLLLLLGATAIGAWLIERRNPPAGAFADIDGTRLHHAHVPAPPGADLPALVFLHGASGNLNDQMLPFRAALEGRAELLFLDRPGHGWSTRGRGNDDLHGQARTVATLMQHLGIGRAVVVGHSFGAALAATLALDHPERVSGLVFLAPATHPWPGGETSWYYALTATPGLGWLFARTLALPAGALRIGAATDCVFSPNPTPGGYLRYAAIELVLRPAAFRANAIDVEGLYRHALALAPRYRDIGVPTVIVTGDSDTVVFEEIHSVGLARDIPGAELVWVRNLGHKPDWIATDLAIAAIDTVAGTPRDLAALARVVEARIAGDRSGLGTCVDAKPAGGGAELAPGQ